MPFIDYYAVLGVSPTSEGVVIKAAFKALMLKYHPDTNSSRDAAEKAQAINAAYAILGDPDKRTAYDRQRDAHFASENQTDTSASKPSPRSSTERPTPPPPQQSESQNFSSYSSPLQNRSRSVSSPAPFKMSFFSWLGFALLAVTMLTVATLLAIREKKTAEDATADYAASAQSHSLDWKPVEATPAPFQEADNYNEPEEEEAISATANSASRTPSGELENLKLLATMEGQCGKLVIANVDLSSFCEPVLANAVYKNENSSFTFIVRDKMIIGFFGTDNVATGNQSSLNVKGITLNLLMGDPPSMTDATGICTYTNPYIGPSHVRCSAYAEGKTYSANFISDGQEPEITEF